MAFSNKHRKAVELMQSGSDPEPVLAHMTPSEWSATNKDGQNIMHMMVLNGLVDTAISHFDKCNPFYDAAGKNAPSPMALAAERLPEAGAVKMLLAAKPLLTSKRRETAASICQTAASFDKPNLLLLAAEMTRAMPGEESVEQNTGHSYRPLPYALSRAFCSAMRKNMTTQATVMLESLSDDDKRSLIRGERGRDGAIYTTLLSTCAASGAADSVKWLLANGADPTGRPEGFCETSTRRSRGRSGRLETFANHHAKPAILAAENGRADAFEALVLFCPELADETDMSGGSVLETLIHSGMWKQAALVAKITSVFSSGRFGRQNTSVESAVANGMDDVAAALVERADSIGKTLPIGGAGAILLLREAKGTPPRSNASDTKALWDKLHEKGLSPESPEFLGAVRDWASPGFSDDRSLPFLSGWQALLSFGMNPDSLFSTGTSCFEAAIHPRLGDQDILSVARAFAKHKANPLSGAEGALSRACLKGSNPRIAAFLAESVAEADPSSKDFENNAANAARAAILALRRSMEENGPASKKWLGVVETLAKRGFAPDLCRSEHQASALCAAVAEKAPEDTVKFLASLCKDGFSSKDNDGRSLAFYARDVKTLRFLVESGTDPTAVGNDGESIASRALCDCDRSERFCSDHETGLKQMSDETLLRIETISSFGLGLANSQDEDGNTKIISMAKEGEFDAVMTLAMAGVDAGLKNRQGKTCLEYLMGRVGRRGDWTSRATVNEYGKPASFSDMIACVVGAIEASDASRQVQGAVSKRSKAPVERLLSDHSEWVGDQGPEFLALVESAAMRIFAERKARSAPQAPKSQKQSI